jgi:hypothetical protein
MNKMKSLTLKSPWAMRMAGSKCHQTKRKNRKKEIATLMMRKVG